MWPFLSRALFPPPTEAWLRRASSDPEAQGWGAWSQTQKTPLGLGAGEEEETGKVEEDNEEDVGILLSLLERGHLAQGPGPDQELEAIKLKLWALEQAQGLERGAEDAGALLAGQLLSPETGRTPLSIDTPTETLEADHRSVYVGNVDYGGTAQELEAYFSHCGEVQRVTVLCDKFSGHPKGYAYIEFATEGSAQAAVELDESVFRGRVIKVLPKRTNLPGISCTDRGGLRGHPGGRGGPFPHSSLQGGARFRPRGRSRWAGRRGRGSGAPKMRPVVFAVLKGGPDFERGPRLARAPTAALLAGPRPPRGATAPRPAVGERAAQAAAEASEAARGAGLAGAGQGCGRGDPRSRGRLRVGVPSAVPLTPFMEK
ncbi:embryonic polyadenylate-binding protein 2 [Hippopotamus amphibius kiboko]|uniref:embryonic polyadenylate-binding protein 2 n=1 Tax=Hippopotamus amphibius kiboko TaxID=575201 RepID=UPI00259728F6|nr:embryonic polyadenylate-binding protein 2 [Hippopotamus amphibius kiboko]